MGRLERRFWRVFEEHPRNGAVENASYNETIIHYDAERVAEHLPGVLLRRDVSHYREL